MTSTRLPSGLLAITLSLACLDGHAKSPGAREVRRFDPTTVLGHRSLPNKQRLQPSKFRVRASLMSDVEKKQDGSRLGSMTLQYGDADIGTATLYQLPRGRAYMNFIGGVESDFRGKGVGSLFYLITARLLHQQRGLVLRTDPAKVSDAAMSVWRRFAREGYARVVDSGTATFRRGVMETEPNFREIDRLLAGDQTLTLEVQLPAKQRAAGLFTHLTRGCSADEIEVIEAEFDWLADATSNQTLGVQRGRRISFKGSEGDFFDEILTRAARYKGRHSD